MPPGGRREGAGRKKGTKNRASIEREAAVKASGLTPLEFLLELMRDAKASHAVRVDAAKAVAPYVHPRLSTVEVGGKGGGPMEVKVVRFSDATESVAAAAVSVAGLVGTGEGL